MSFFNRFSSLWASKGTVSPPSDTQSDQGFSYLGQIPPSVELFNGMFQERDWKIKWLYQQISSVIGLDGSQPSETETGKAGGVLKNWFLPIRNPTILGTTTMLGSLELGSQSVSSVAYIDFHTDGTNTDYNARIIALGGSPGQIGSAGISFYCSDVFVPTIQSNVDNGNRAATTAFVQSRVSSAISSAVSSANTYTDGKQPGGLTRELVLGATTTWSVPSGVTRIKARVWGGGGGSGGTGQTNDAARGGGGGGYVECYFSVVPGDSLSIVVGGGGSGGAPGNYGVTGGDSAISKNGTTFIYVHGGGGGQGGSGSGIMVGGGAGGDVPVAPSGSLSRTGDSSGIAILMGQSGSTYLLVCSAGGGVFWGGWTQRIAYAGTQSVAGPSGVYPGGGAGGSAHSQQYGSPGAAGLVILEY
ncbi:putative exported protein [Granulibacter bethesdensis]|uniref:Exported protein n=1 Tax=Granulibacter bethesdensis TaxID=364410 RepID=A0AAC9KAV3_9PROT|nr:hypothetical protein [Granulibacter bethesdensis]APH54839.1 putative exported protein [Granulibacter bethesdensis]APH62425.1 putative exported protein [Granulibacter bethesdensis]